MLTLTAWEIRRRTRRGRFVLGTACSTRETAIEARIVGYYINMLPLSCKMENIRTFEEALRTMHGTLQQGLQHGRYPFSRILDDFQKQTRVIRHPARHPLFDIAVTENPGPAPLDQETRQDTLFSPLTDSGNKAPSYEWRSNGPSQDMLLIHEENEGGAVTVSWYVNAALYDQGSAQAWIDALVAWAEIFANPERREMRPLPTLLAEEKSRLAKWQYSGEMAAPAPTIPERLTQLAQSQPHAPALIVEGGSISYSTINTRSDAIVQALCEQGVKKGAVVGVYTGRSITLPETVLAIWKAGGCYLPLANDLPDERLGFMVRDAGVQTLMVMDGLIPPSSITSQCSTILRPETIQEQKATPVTPVIKEEEAGTHLAYIIYTSGSTGTPKGVLINHKGLCNLGVSLADALEIGPSDRILLLSSPGFDAWISDLVMAWSIGASVVPITRKQMDDLPGMQERLIGQKVTIATLPPSYLHLFRQTDFPSLRTLMTVGEAPNMADARHYAQRLNYINGYGPTENTAAASVGRMNPEAKRLTAGKPLANTAIYIKNNQGECLPPYSIGEIWLGGVGVANGYLNQRDLTNNYFKETPQGRLYRTGDLGRWTQSGEIEILGRSDGQVKFQGQRLELGEIEHILSRFPGVTQNVVLFEKDKNGKQVLWAFVVMDSSEQPPSQTKWQDRLLKKLPGYMVPSAVIAVPSIPITLSGKVDRLALLERIDELTGLSDGFFASEKEKRIAAVWQAVLDCPVLDRNTHFFQLGGTSLSAIAVIDTLRREYDCAINDLYEQPILKKFSRQCRQSPDHLHTALGRAAKDWQSHQHNLSEFEKQKNQALQLDRETYLAKSKRLLENGSRPNRTYQTVLLTGATGYLGCYLLRELLVDKNRQVIALVRGDDQKSAQTRLGRILRHYFGPEKGDTFLNARGLEVLVADLRCDKLGLSPERYEGLARSLDAIFHSAAKVSHFGHASEFIADNVEATQRLLNLAAQDTTKPTDFHHISTLSVHGQSPKEGFKHFTEYDQIPEELDGNYYIRTKQEAEGLVLSARNKIANACIYRVGNLVFPSDGGSVQINIAENAFFKQVAAFIRLGVVPDDASVHLSHIDLVARGIRLLAECAPTTNSTHHIENSRKENLADLIVQASDPDHPIRSLDFQKFMERLHLAIQEPKTEHALMLTMESLNLFSGRFPGTRMERLDICSDQTHGLLAALDFNWPTLSTGNLKIMFETAARLSLSPAFSSRETEVSQPPNP
jgi:amino acid adenylation domain-containing protein/thioester reductase-like protein